MKRALPCMATSQAKEGKTFVSLFFDKRVESSFGKESKSGKSEK
jgi:hypothetical protein